MEHVIRRMKKGEENLLEEFLYQAIFIPEGMTPPDRSIIKNPELSMYIDNFGCMSDDTALVLEKEGKTAGAVWARIIDDYGHVDDDTPSLAISLLPEYRSRGAGTEMMKKMIEVLRTDGYEAVSLSVQKDNYALEMYRKLGFLPVRENDEELVMVLDLK